MHVSIEILTSGILQRIAFNSTHLCGRKLFWCPVRFIFSDTCLVPVRLFFLCRQNSSHWHLLARVFFFYLLVNVATIVRCVFFRLGWHTTHIRWSSTRRLASDSELVNRSRPWSEWKLRNSYGPVILCEYSEKTFAIYIQRSIYRMSENDGNNKEQLRVIDYAIDYLVASTSCVSPVSNRSNHLSLGTRLGILARFTTVMDNMDDCIPR